ncbi:N-acetylmuramoyl-L-alanine amidase [Sphaerisporangium siamense]|uniref:Peptidoglycan recognition protein family domain-containing protein n=1 Tax=Sphaerisporangium siamense TaxID=795645 RepID=A0A7W7DAW3_9ACTN|nr:N-acetylmuramoyl-L-alanine amidase [Sphaerisporangium siamense]MBB4702590.1 hypothetical protein [Sphaerisporangium siamense]GII88292.1 N-acetylmuramoyl-L-alanine amidase [Sphaerisporangium siamense]
MSIDLITRKAWGARPPKGSYSALSSTKGVKVHYTGDRVDPGLLDDHDRCVAKVRQVQAFHMNGNGWIDIGYSMVACPHRKVFVGRGPGHVCAANGAGLNSAHYAVLALVGNSGLVEPNDELLLGVLDAIDYLREHGGAGHEIKGHRDGYATDCPGGALYAWVRKGAPRPGGKSPAPTIPASGTKSPLFPGRLLAYPPVVRGEDVRVWQTQMKRRGWAIDVDGAYGAASRAVCVAFQKEKGLGADGVVGRDTWRAAFELPVT